MPLHQPLAPDTRYRPTQITGTGEHARIVYVNPTLVEENTAPCIWGRALAERMRLLDVNFITIPAIPKFRASESRQRTVTSNRLRRYIKKFVPVQLHVLLVEWHLLVRALLRTPPIALNVLFRRSRYRVDAVLGRTVEYDWTPWLVAKILRCPLILEVHSPFYLERQLRGCGFSRLVRGIDVGLWRRADRIWTISHELKDILVVNGISAKKIEFIPYGFETDHIRTVADQGARDQVTVAFIGSFYVWHGIEDLIEAFAKAHERLPSLRLLLIGNGVLSSPCQRRVQALGLEDVVDFAGWLPRTKALDVMVRAQIGVAPYKRIEPFYFDPAKIIDYMGLGLAVIASEQGRISKMLEDGKSGILIEPGSVEQLTEAIVKLATDRKLRLELGLAARKNIEQKWSLDQTVRRVLSLCDQSAERLPSQQSR